MKRDSWHYKLAKIGNDNNTIYDMSICEYVRKVFWGGVLAAFAITVLTGILIGFGVGVYELIGAALGFAVLGKAAITVLVVLAIVIVVVALIYASYTWRNKSEQLLRKENNSFVAKAYKSYKQKVCFNVEFDDE